LTDGAFFGEGCLAGQQGAHGDRLRDVRMHDRAVGERRSRAWMVAARWKRPRRPRRGLTRRR
jgi:hypothetical protein